MDLPINQVADLLSASLKWVDPDNIYTSFVTPDEDTTGKTTFIRVQDAVSQLDRYRNDDPAVINAGVEVQVFFSTDGDVNIFQAKLEIIRLLQTNGWLVQRPLSPDTTDPDTSQKTITIYANKNLEIR